MQSLPSYTIVLNAGSIGPAWDIATAIKAAQEAETTGRIALRIEQGREVVLTEAQLRVELEKLDR